VVLLTANDDPVIAVHLMRERKHACSQIGQLGPRHAARLPRKPAALPQARAL